MFSFLKFLLIKIIIPLLVFSPAILYIFISPANYSETFEIPRENVQNIKILRNEFGVPHIKAQNLRDVFYGLGYAQAQDRLWEMSFKRLIFSGRLSEFFDEKTLTIDKTMRNFGFYRTSKINYEHMPTEEQDYIQAFADGVNDYVKKLQVLPVEFLVTGVKFEEWKPYDTIVMLKLMEFSLTLKWNQQFLRHTLEEFYEREFIKEFSGCGEENQNDHTFILNDDELTQSNIFVKNNKTKKTQNQNKSAAKKGDPKFKIAHDDKNTSKDKYLSEGLKNIMDSLYEVGRGSNSWVIHGDHTKTGKPILANDPHLDNAIPSIWYPAYIQYKDGENLRNIFGFSNAGSPFLVIGQNEKVSWGITALLGDDSDLYKEELNEEQTHFLSDGKFYPLETLTEEIKVKNGETVIETIKLTKHGVILNKLFDFQIGPSALKESDDVFSFSWTGYLKNNYMVKSVLGIYNSKNVYEFKESANIFESVYLNLIFADIEGNIGYLGSGLHKLRRKDADDFFPLDGTNSKDDWLGYVPKNESPFVINPKKGYIVTANNKFSSDNLKNEYSHVGKPTARALRINNMIKAFIANGTKIGTEEVKRMQQDSVDEYANIMNPLMVEILKNNLKLVTNETNRNTVLEAVSLLENWDGNMAASSKKATVYNVWLAFLSKRLLNHIQPDILKKRITNFYGFEQFLMKKLYDWRSGKNLDAEYCQNEENTNQNNPCISNVINSLLETNSFLEDKFGKDKEQWKWDNLHFARYPHKPFSSTPLRYFYEKIVPRSGNMNTVNVAVMKTKIDGFESAHSANMRFISNLDRKETSYFGIDTGISECPFSPHYTDLMELHHSGRYLEINLNLSEENAFYKTELKRAE